MGSQDDPGDDPAYTILLCRSVCLHGHGCLHAAHAAHVACVAGAWMDLRGGRRNLGRRKSA